VTWLRCGPAYRPGRGVLQVSLHAGPDSALHAAAQGGLSSGPSIRIQPFERTRLSQIMTVPSPSLAKLSAPVV
jgi:hypothetical protein